MAGEKIKISIECEHIAPIEHLKRDIQAGSLKIGIFANNGSGKTFLSRLFRILELPPKKYSLNENGSSPTDYLIKFGNSTGNFTFKIIDKKGSEIENLSLNIQNKKIPTIPNPHFLYHVFNQDYVDENIRELSYEKDSDIQGYILGKTNINLKADEERLEKIKTDGINLKSQIERSIQSYKTKNIDSIRDIKRLNEYKKNLAPDYIIKPTIEEHESLKTVEELLIDYNKVKSIPENLPDIQLLNEEPINLELIEQIIQELNISYNISSFSDEFKTKIKGNQVFIEEGIKLINNNQCPFCGQILSVDAVSLIDSYIKFFNDSESQTIKMFQKYAKQLQDYISILTNIEKSIIQRNHQYNEYKIKYIPALEKENLELATVIEPFIRYIQELVDFINKKIESINISIKIEKDILHNIKKCSTALNTLIKRNNQKIQIINQKKNKAGEENKCIRKSICKSAYIYLYEINKKDITKLYELREEYKKLYSDILKRKETEKISKKKKVYETIKSVLDYFFSGKYTLNEDDFHLIFNNRSLDKGQVKHVLSEGEKNIIAFAYYLGDTHLKVEKEDDYNKLFFIIDDPISSMDFTYVYTLCGVIRDIKQILKKIDREKIIIFTHNNDFMRILCANNIVDKKLLLQNGELIDFNENFTVPYISHLIDIYRIARKGEKAKHTTANSIRHIIETLTKFQNIEISDNSIAEYIKKNIPNDKKSYTFINDLSHGGWRSEQTPITDNDYKEVCETVIEHIEKLFPNQIKYCENIIENYK